MVLYSFCSLYIMNLPSVSDQKPVDFTLILNNTESWHFLNSRSFHLLPHFLCIDPSALCCINVPRAKHNAQNRKDTIQSEFSQLSTPSQCYCVFLHAPRSALQIPASALTGKFRINSSASSNHLARPTGQAYPPYTQSVQILV